MQSILSGESAATFWLPCLLPFYLSFSVYAVVRGLPPLLLDLERLSVARDHAARRHLARPVVSKHKIVRSENAWIALNLRFLNLHRFLGRTLHEVVLSRRMRTDRSPVISLRGHRLIASCRLVTSHDLHAAGDLRAMAATNWPFLSVHEATAHS